jgi:hypothetical protein
LLVERFFVPRLENDSETDIDFGYFESFSIFSPSLQSEILADASESSDDESDSTESASTIKHYAAEGSDLYYGAPFECIDSNNRIYRISPNFTGPTEVYKFIGSIMARVLLGIVPLRVRLAPSLVKTFLGKTLTYEDLKDEDPILYRSFMKCLEPDFDFETAAYNLLSDESVMVDAENIVVFLNEKAAEIMYLRYKDQIDQFVEGFRSVLNVKYLEAFFASSSELETVLSGVIQIDRLDLYSHIEFSDEY